MSNIKHFESLYPVESRDLELSSLVSYIQEGNSAQLLGLPGVGRSNILGLLAHNREVRLKHFPTRNTYVHFVFVNFSEVHGRPLLDVTKLMFLNLVDSLRERDMQEEYAVANEILRESLVLQDEFVIFQGMKRVVEYLAVEKKLTLIFLFDRFEEYVPMLSHAFFSNLRILRNIAKYRFSVIFTGYKALEDILESSLMADFHEFVAGHIVYLGLKDEPSLAFRLAYLEELTHKKLPEEIKQEMLTLTGGHWKLTRLSAESLLAASEAMPEDIQAYLLKQKTIQGALKEILSAFTPSELKYLINVILGSKVTPESPAERFRTSRNDDTIDSDERIYEYLNEIGILKGDLMTIPLLTNYINTHMTLSQETKEPIVFDIDKNVIRKGDTVLSDGLTAAEYRLLTYLINNPERVISRDEVITVVWQEAKSTAGVTDQAVDQLIFRIRRKIEENPNQPKHLITVKGRGFSFSP